MKIEWDFTARRDNPNVQRLGRHLKKEIGPAYGLDEKTQPSEAKTAKKPTLKVIASTFDGEVLL